MGRIGGSSCQTTSRKCATVRILVEACVSYRKLNQVTCQFTFPILFCDDAVQDIYTEANHFIAVDMKSRYWQVVAEEKARKRLELFTPDRNWW